MTAVTILTTLIKTSIKQRAGFMLMYEDYFSSTVLSRALKTAFTNWPPNVLKRQKVGLILLLLQAVSSSLHQPVRWINAEIRPWLYHLLFGASGEVVGDGDGGEGERGDGFRRVEMGSCLYIYEKSIMPRARWGRRGNRSPQWCVTMGEGGDSWWWDEWWWGIGYWWVIMCVLMGGNGWRRVVKETIGAL